MSEVIELPGPLSPEEEKERIEESAEFFKSVGTFVKYLYDEYKQDVPIPCIVAHYSPDCVWVFGGVKNEVFPLAGTCKGRQGIAQFLKKKGELITVNKWDRKEYIVQKDGNKVIAILDCDYTIKATGVSYQVEEVHIHTVVNWQSVKVQILFDYTPVLAAWAKKTEQAKK